ncbi:CBS domain-containing protein, partial [Flavobacterium sp. 17A]|nr:CBS domain-containing protein [Flavobacterium potami]
LSKLMLKENFSGVPVRGPENQLAGIITKTDLLEFIVELEEVH